MRSRIVCYACLSLLAVAPGIVSAQSGAPESNDWTVPRTADGDPDLQGVWANNNATPLERPDILGERTTLTAEELAALQARAADLFSLESGDAAFGDSVFAAALAEAQSFTSRDAATGNYNQFWLVERDWDNRTSLVVDPPDGQIPDETAGGQARLTERAAARRRPAIGPEDRSLGERCVSFGVPRLGAGYNSYYHFAQTKDHVVILMEMAHDARIIPLDGRPHLDAGIRQLHGDSRGHWDGDTLVVETTNYSSTTYVRGASEKLHVVERFTRVGPETLQYEVTLTDPTTWTAPWTAMIPLRRSTDPIFEYACHEGNLGMAGILTGARAQEASAGR